MQRSLPGITIFYGFWNVTLNPRVRVFGFISFARKKQAHTHNKQSNTLINWKRNSFRHFCDERKTKCEALKTQVNNDLWTNDHQISWKFFAKANQTWCRSFFFYQFYLRYCISDASNGASRRHRADQRRIIYYTFAPTFMHESICANWKKNHRVCDRALLPWRSHIMHSSIRRRSLKFHFIYFALLLFRFRFALNLIWFACGFHWKWLDGDCKLIEKLCTVSFTLVCASSFEMRQIAITLSELLALMLWSMFAIVVATIYGVDCGKRPTKMANKTNKMHWYFNELHKQTANNNKSNSKSNNARALFFASHPRDGVSETDRDRERETRTIWESEKVHLNS